MAMDCVMQQAENDAKEEAVELTPKYKATIRHDSPKRRCMSVRQAPKPSENSNLKGCEDRHAQLDH